MQLEAIECLRIHYGIEVDTLTPLPFGADSRASVYKVTSKKGINYFLKIKEGHEHDVSIAIVGFLHHAGIKEIILPLKSLHGLPVQHLGNDTLVVYPFIEGENGFIRKLTHDQWIQLGRALRQLHEMEVPPALKERVREESFSPKWRDAVRSLYSHMDKEIMGDEIAIKLAKFMKENAEIIHCLVNEAHLLARKIKRSSPPFVLCHSDIHAGNVLIDGKLLYIVDWDEPILAPKERDLMFIGGGVGNVWNDPREVELFYKGYGNTQIDQDILAYNRKERIIEDIALYGNDLLLIDGGKNRPENYRLFTDMFAPRGCVEIALKS